MNYKYQTKPTIKEAFQMTKERREDRSEWPDWLFNAWRHTRDGEAGSLFLTDTRDPNCTFSITTLEGDHEVSYGDYIIQGLKGELYPCKPDIFEKSYTKFDPKPTEEFFAVGAVISDSELPPELRTAIEAKLTEIESQLAAAQCNIRPISEHDVANAMRSANSKMEANDQWAKDNGVTVSMDGDKWCAVAKSFINLQESPAGFGDSIPEALYHLRADMESCEPAKSNADNEVSQVDSKGKRTKAKTLHNSDASGTKENVSDVKFYGNGDTWTLLCKASSKAEGWMKSTKALQTKDGCLVQVTTQQGENVAEALAFVPGATILEEGGIRKLA